MERLLQKTIWQLKKKKPENIQQFHFWIHTQNNRKQSLKHMCTPMVIIRFIHNSQKVEANQLSIQNVVYT